MTIQQRSLTGRKGGNHGIEFLYSLWRRLAVAFFAIYKNIYHLTIYKFRPSKMDDASYSGGTSKES